MNSTENNPIGTSKELIQFQLDLSYNYTLTAPEIIVCLNGIVKFKEPLSGNNCSIKFEHVLDFGQPYTLHIYRAGKTDQDPGQMLIVDRIIIDGNNVQDLIWGCSYYEPSYPELWYSQQVAQGTTLETKVYGETHLGHNGLWTLNFTSPFWSYLLDQMGE